MAPKRKTSSKKSQATQPTITPCRCRRSRWRQSIKEHFAKYRGKGGEHEDNEE